MFGDLRSLVLALGVAIATCLGGAASADDSGSPQPVLVFAAASLKNALDAAAQAFEKTTSNTVKISYAASSTLAKQLEQDAPAQMFISADLDWMNYVEDKGLIKPGTRSNLLGNKLVLVAPKDSTVAIDLHPGADLTKALGGGRLAMGLVDSVPAGKYGKAALEKLGIWTSVSGQLAQADSVRAALALVSRGETPLGIVYQTDAAADPSVKVVAAFPDGSYPPIIYPIALTAKAGPAAGTFVNYLKSKPAALFFQAQGFTVLDAETGKRS